MDYGDEMVRQLSAAYGKDLTDELSDETKASLGESMRLMVESAGGHVHIGDTCTLDPPCRESRKARLRIV